MNVFLEVGKVLLYVYSTKHTGVDILLCHFFSFLYGVCNALVSRGHEINTKFRISLPCFRKDQPYMKNNLALFKVDEPKLLYYYLSSYMTINNNVFPYQYGLLVICSMNSSIRNDIIVMGGWIKIDISSATSWTGTAHHSGASQLNPVLVGFVLLDL